MRLVAAITAALLAAHSGEAGAASCPPAGSVGKARGRECAPPARRIEPHDPDRLKSGSRPGFIDLGGGTEVRVGGRARYEYEGKR